MINVTEIPMTYIQAPIAIPTPDVAHIPAAVVKPVMLFLCINIIPAPRKPIPLAMVEATLDGSSLTSTPLYNPCEQTSPVSIIIFIQSNPFTFLHFLKHHHLQVFHSL